VISVKIQWLTRALAGPHQKRWEAVLRLVALEVHQWVVGDSGVHREAEDLAVLQEAVASGVPQAALEVLPVDSEGEALAEAILHVEEVVTVAVSEAEDAAGESQLRPMS